MLKPKALAQYNNNINSYYINYYNINNNNFNNTCKFVQSNRARLFYEGVSVTPNIEKHAGAPLYPVGLKHVHPQYNQYERLTYKIFDQDLDNLVGILKYEHANDDIPSNPLDYVKVADINCECDHKILYEQIFGDPMDQPSEVMAYKTCKHTIFGAAKRQMKAAPTPEPAVADDFLQYAINIIEKEVGEDLTHFGYSYQDWYNHLNLKKQNDMELVYTYFIDKTVLTKAQIKTVEQLNYEGICKVELQGTNGKPRMVCSIPLQTKFAMGPICWHLEEIFAEKLQGYCGGKNLTEMADMINKYIDLGFTKVVEGDGSAFDNTQDVTLKRVDQYIYSRVLDKVYHVPKEVFKKIAIDANTKTMDILYMNPRTKKRECIMQYTILGSVFSGDADTTLCNTTRMALYNRYVNDKAGLKFGVDYVVFSKGDDFTVMYKPNITDQFIHNLYYKYFLPASDTPDKADTRVYGLGQVLKMLDIGGPEIIKFCSLRAWPIDRHGHIMLTRDPAKFTTLAKYSRKMKCYNLQQRLQYLIDQATAIYASYKGIDYFEAMARAYLLKAHDLIQHLPEAEQTAMLLRINPIRDRRRDKALGKELQENRTMEIINGVKHRKVIYKIGPNYWETMKNIYKINVIKYTPEQLKYINSAVAKEFNIKALYRALGLIKRNEGKK